MKHELSVCVCTQYQMEYILKGSTNTPKVCVKTEVQALIVVIIFSCK